MATFAELEVVLRQHVSDPGALAQFYDAAARALKALGRNEVAAAELERNAQEMRWKKLKFLAAEGKYEEALRYDRDYKIMIPDRRRELARKLWRQYMEQGKYWRALELARAEFLTDCAKEAAIRYSDAHLENDFTLKEMRQIVRGERAGDTKFQEQFALAAYHHMIRYEVYHEELPQFVADFRGHFSDVEIELADFLAKAKKDRR